MTLTVISRWSVCHMSFHVLLVEDNPADAALVGAMLREHGLPHDLHTVADGVEALRFLMREDEFAEAPTPHLVLLDLNLPKLNGHRVLERIKHSEDLRHIPVVIFSSSRQVEDVHQAYCGYANSYIVKPMELNQYDEVIKSLRQYWFNTAHLPAPQAVRPAKLAN